MIYRVTQILSALAATLTLGVASPVQAATLFLDNFDSEANPGAIASSGCCATGGAPSNWTAGVGTILHTVVGGPSGSGNAMFLDGLDGSQVPDAIAVTTAAINTAGQSNLALTFDYYAFHTEGNDKLELWAAYNGGAFSLLTNPALILGPAGSTGGDPGLPWTTYALLFANPGSTSAKFEFRFYTSSGTEYVMIDNFRLDGDVSAVPLPAALPLLASGLGGMGLAGWWRRRRRTQSHHGATKLAAV